MPVLAGIGLPVRAAVVRPDPFLLLHILLMRMRGLHPMGSFLMMRRLRLIPALLMMDGLFVAMAGVAIVVMMDRTARKNECGTEDDGKGDDAHRNLLFLPVFWVRGSSYALRNVAVARRPPSGRFSSTTSPSCMRAMLLAMDSPSPVPPVLRLLERSTR